MENENIIDYKNASNEASNLSLTSEAVSYLSETRGWGKFLAIVGFVLIGLMVIAGFFVGSMLASMGQQNPFGGFIGVFYVLMGLLYFFPTLYLYRFSAKLKIAIAHKDNEALTQAFENLKSLYKFMGIFMVILIGFYVLVGGGAFLVSLFA